MEQHLLEDIPWQIDLAQLARQLHLTENQDALQELEQLVAQAQAIGRPKAFYALARVEAYLEQGVVVNGIELRSRVLRVNLEHVHRVFPFVATCGNELEDWSQSVSNRLLHRFWADQIKESALRSAITYMRDHLVSHYQPGQIAQMNPGSLADWPLGQQKPLFRILGTAPQRIGVRLTERMLMIPTKSVSGIIFPTETTFENCQLCPLEPCPSRRAVYDPTLYSRRYQSPVHASSAPDEKT
ncbi:MAG: vitamin B12 dependent-methionine synthase activation domain-containing protein [Anaerolineae bacterium]|nr:vitamin B12 dependent-methionine synthase activation domain-containing protein [Anaerolineae bacterium]